MKIVRFKLAEILKAKHITRRECAEKTGIRYPTVNDFCTNKTKSISVENLGILCEVLNVDINELLEVVENQVEREIVPAKIYG